MEIPGEQTHGSDPERTYPDASDPASPPDLGAAPGGGAGRCADCGWPLAEPVRVVSRHRTKEGVVVYARCVCGRLRVWVEPRGGAARRLVIGGTDAPLPCGGE